jgi:hypothetical protein
MDRKGESSPFDDSVDVSRMLLWIEAVLLAECGTTLLDSSTHSLLDPFVENGILDSLLALEEPEVGRDGMAGVEAEELALVVRRQVVGELPAFDRRKRLLERAAADDPFVETFDADIETGYILAGVERRNDTVDGTVSEADVLGDPDLVDGFGKSLEDSVLENGSGADGILSVDQQSISKRKKVVPTNLTSNDVHDITADLSTLDETLGDGGSNTVKNIHADGGGEDMGVGVRNGSNDVFGG